MTDDDAREYGAKILAMASTYGELAEFVRHAVRSVDDRAALVEAADSHREFALVPVLHAARRHMEGQP